MCSRSSAIRCAASARVMKERIAEAARLVCCRSRAGRLYSGRRSHGEVAGGQGVRSQSARCSEGHDRVRPGLPGRDLRPPLERQARHRRAAREAHGHLGAGGDRGDPPALPGRLRSRRPREGADAHAERAPGRRGDGAPPPPPRALAHRHARPQLDGRARGGAPARARAVTAGRNRLAELLGMPSTCPHGNPIPGMSKPTRVEPFPLAQAKEGVTVVVERITEEAEADKKLLEHLWKNDVRPGRRLKITEVAPWAGTITAASDGQTITLGLPAAAKIWVYLPQP